MPNNPYTREVHIDVAELVPQNGNLPYCHAVQRDGTTRCAFRARYHMDGRPLCGMHLRPGAMFFPERMIHDGE